MEARAICLTTPAALVALLIPTVMLSMAPFQIVASGIAKPGCRETCGGIQIPYPFGISPNCSLPGFEISCNISNGWEEPFLSDNMPVLYIDLSEAQVQVNSNITSICSSNTTNGLNLSGTPYRINNRKDKFTVIGCDINAYITFGNETNMHQGGCSTMGCYSRNSIDYNGVCSGSGCCQIYIPTEISYYHVTLQHQNYSSSKEYNSSQCGYAVLTDSFSYGGQYDPEMIINNLYEQQINDVINSTLYKQQPMKLDLDWSIGNESCEAAQASKSSFAFISDNSECVDSNNGLAYWCMCFYGYEGNPYLEGGCPDVLVDDSYPCPAFMRPKKNSTGGECQLYVPYVIGTC